MGIMAYTRQFKPSQLLPGLLYDITASYALSASYLIGLAEPYRIVSGSLSAEVNTVNNIFLIKDGTTNILSITQSGVLVLATQSAELTDPAPTGGIYFTSSSFFVGLE
jgi:hypothetical protein